VLRAPLAHVRVVDLTRVLAGPFCTMLLGDMGADVIKIEEPDQGDDTRGWAPFVSGWSSYFLGVNRNKRSVALNIKTEAGAEALRRLVGTADVLVENFRPGTLDRFGFGYEQLAAANPRLIYASISGYGQTGPRRELAGYDPVLQAETGLMDITGTPDGPPVRVGVAMTDYVAGLFALSGILLALRSRDQSGRGQRLDLSLFDSLMSTMTLPAGIFFATGEKPPRMGNQHPSIAPYETFNARDGAVMVCAGNPRLWQQFCTAVGRPDLPLDARFGTNEGRLRERGALVAEIERTLGEMTVDEVISALVANGVPCGRVRSIDQALADPQLQARGMVISLPHRTLGQVEVIGNPLMLSDTPAAYRLPPPALGEHTAEVLQSLGYTPEETARVAPGSPARRLNHPDARDRVFTRS
jgi:crotonobetainyl-CoA:carnitine CoA-transferase CaiB-like acyl-CoA transferase